jgi:mono/diheme cytochrome c family protein
MFGRIFPAALAASMLFAAVAARADLPATPLEPARIDIADPTRYWRDGGFVELTPAIRVSTAPGWRTVVYLRIPDGGRIATQMLADQGRSTLLLPPGSASDRVSLTADAGGQWTVDDVRGTRWGADGREYFHVYRPTGAGLGAPLQGWEWPRDDPHRANAASALLTALVRDSPQPFSGALPSWGEVMRFRALNQCQQCHVADKPMAGSDRAALPPWATDASGLYVPLAVLADRAPLSTTPMFSDPNAGAPFVVARCGDAPAREHMGRRSRWFSCPDDGVPMGVLDVAAARAAGDPHAERLCASRRYLFERMDSAGREAFAAAFAVCGIG